uniref:Myb/SANT-like DNA-binding domain-containing protein n=1 Tax=Anopheles culicifacies TaxID=139723 RepID=A0A182MTW0_9DIPT
MNKRNIWKYEETKEMLQIMLDNNYAGSFSNKHKQNMEIFRRIEHKMVESGYRYKNFMQIGVRWKNLKNLYTKAKRSNSKNEQQLFPYYEEMDSLLNRSLKKSSSEEYICTSDHEKEGYSLENSTEQFHNTANDSAPEAETETVHIKTTHTNEQKHISPTKVGTRHVSAQSHKPDRSSKLSATIAASKQELSDEFYRTQKRLIDYEFNLYVRQEEALIERMQETTRSMLEESMDMFFNRLKDVLGTQSVQHVEYDGAPALTVDILRRVMLGLIDGYMQTSDGSKYLRNPSKFHELLGGMLDTIVIQWHFDCIRSKHFDHCTAKQLNTILHGVSTYAEPCACRYVVLSATEYIDCYSHLHLSRQQYWYCYQLWF